MIKPLRFYQIPWSHFCDKVRWALDYKDIPYEIINFNAFGKTKGLERAPKTIRKLMPLLEDPNTNDDNLFIPDSTPILLYLESRYPKLSKSLFPSSNDERQQVIDTCLRLDSELGLYARRLAYVQLLKDKPNAMSVLVAEKFSWALNPDDIRSRMVSPFIAAFMVSRFRLHRISDDCVKEKTEQLLLDFGDRLRKHEYLVGEHFTAADLTFCALVKPLRSMPCFINDRRFRIIFDYHERIRRQHDPKYPNIDNFLEKLIEKHRLETKKNENNLYNRAKRFLHQINFVQKFFIAFMTMFVKNFYGLNTDDEMPQFKSSTQDKQNKEAFNDQRRPNINSTWTLIKFLFKYQCHLYFTIPKQIDYLQPKSQ